MFQGGTLGEGNKNAQNVKENAATLLPFTHLIENHYLSINTYMFLSQNLL